ncbi:transposable element Tcb1 transposase [Trichonephila clavipes]|nr:transposable element Tcb1 transposase [Trichonephila clavipes]
MSSRRFRRQYGQLLQFERGKIIGMMEAGLGGQIEGHLGSWRLLRVLALTPPYRHLRLEWCHARGNRTAAEWNQVVFSDDTKFKLISDDNRVRVWRHRGERLNTAFVLQ